MIGDGIAETSNDADVLGNHDNFENENSQIEMGTVGHEGAATHFQDGASATDGNTLVAVSLFRGRDRSKPVTPGLAQGQQVWCQLSSTVFRIPKPGTRVMVAFPGGMQLLAGAGVIFATLEKSPTIQFSETKAKLDYGADVDLVIKARSITLTDYSNRQISMCDQGGIQLFDEQGAGLQIRTGGWYSVGTKFNFVAQSGSSMVSSIKLEDGSLSLVEASGNLIKMASGQITLATGKFVAQYTVGMLGRTAVAANSAVTTVGGVPTPSASTWIGPT